MKYAKKCQMFISQGIAPPEAEGIELDGSTAAYTSKTLSAKASSPASFLIGKRSLILFKIESICFNSDIEC